MSGPPKLTTVLWKMKFLLKLGIETGTPSPRSSTLYRLLSLCFTPLTMTLYDSLYTRIHHNTHSPEKINILSFWQYYMSAFLVAWPISFWDSQISWLDCWHPTRGSLIWTFLFKFMPWETSKVLWKSPWHFDSPFPVVNDYETYAWTADCGLHVSALWLC